MASVTVSRTEAGRDGKPARIYHEGGYQVVDGVKVVKYAWTHPVDEKSSCVACQRGKIPDHVKRGVR